MIRVLIDKQRILFSEVWDGVDHRTNTKTRGSTFTEAQLDWIDRLIAAKLEATGVTHREPSQAHPPAEGPTTLTAPPTDSPGTSSAVPLGLPVGPAGTTPGHSGASIMPGNTTGEQIQQGVVVKGLKKKKIITKREARA